MAKEVDFADREHYINTIAEDYLLKGINNATRIAKDLKIPRKDVLMYIEEWRSVATTGDTKARAEELLYEMDQSYSKIINELWNSHEEADSAKDAAGILKIIAEVTAKRQEVLQKAGFYDDAAMGDELALVEEQMQGIKNLLKVISEKYGEVPGLRRDLMEGLGEIFKVPMAMPLDPPKGIDS